MVKSFSTRNIDAGYGNTTSGNMLVFDKLPKAARLALANADHNWSGEQLYRAYKSRRVDGARNVSAIIQTIAEHDVKKHRADAQSGLVMEGQR